MDRVGNRPLPVFGVCQPIWSKASGFLIPLQKPRLHDNLQLLFHTVGGVVTPAEKLLSIVPAKSPLVVKAQIQNQDIGFVRVGQEVAIKADAFEFQKYGMYEGKVKLISKDSHEEQEKSCLVGKAFRLA